MFLSRSIKSTSPKYREKNKKNKKVIKSGRDKTTKRSENTKN